MYLKKREEGILKDFFTILAKNKKGKKKYFKVASEKEKNKNTY